MDDIEKSRKMAVISEVKCKHTRGVSGMHCIKNGMYFAKVLFGTNCYFVSICNCKDNNLPFGKLDFHSNKLGGALHSNKLRGLCALRN